MEPAYQLDFPALTGQGVKVGVVDSGIDPSHPRVGPLAGSVEFAFGPSGQIHCREASGDLAGHGTACAGLIRRKAPAAALYSLRILDASQRADLRLLATAIRWAAAQGLDLLNLSLGTVQPEGIADLQAACREAAAAGLILVAAAHEEGLLSYPAVFPEVIGVRGGAFSQPYGYYYREGEPTECVARGEVQRLCWLEGREVLAGGNSFAAARLSGLVALVRQAFPGADLHIVRRALKANALLEESQSLRPAPSPQWEKPFAWLRRAALYPFGKEMHALVRFADLLPFRIAGIADPAGRGLAGKDAGEALGLAACGLRIAPRLEAVCRDADTLILGHVDQLGRLQRRDLLRESVALALERRMHVFSFGPVRPADYGDLHEKAQARGLRLCYPDVPVEEVEQTLARAPSAPRVEVPVLGVFGTSSSQGKFTVQLILRRKLLERGYQVGQLGTEPHAELFGMDLVFPSGYDSPLVLRLQDYAPYLDARLRELCQLKQPDLIVVGSQSGTIPYDPEEPSTCSLASLAFLCGTQPDACVLVINSIDPEEYIADTLEALRVVGRAPAILLAMSDQEKQWRQAWGRGWIGQRQMSAPQIEEHLRRLEDRFGLPAVSILSPAGQERMVDLVLRHFAAEGT
ncbi:MAG: S8 family serine peptidase [Candidatus Latescibacteria bacterium]|nr:S8 family serine peptidase [Candidatus Latescibacterota bacterium]